MSQCSVDFFNTKLELVYHDEVEFDGIDLDYLTPEATQFDISQTTAVTVQNIVRFFGYNNFLGIVDSVQQNEGFTTVSVKPFNMLFDHAVLFNTDWQFEVDHYRRTVDERAVHTATKIRSYYSYSYETDEYTLVDIQTTEEADTKFPAMLGWFVYMPGDKYGSDGKMYHWTEDREWNMSKTYYFAEYNEETEQYDFIPKAKDIHMIEANPRLYGFYELKETDSICLEKRLQELIYRYYINPYSKDDEQKIPISFNLTSETLFWTFDVVPDQEIDPDDCHAIVEFYDVIIQKALTQYRVAIEPDIDFTNHCIVLNIGKVEDTKVIEADLPWIAVNEFSIKKMDSDINKLEIWNSEGYDKKIWNDDAYAEGNEPWTWDSSDKPDKNHVSYFYLHKSGDFDKDRTRDRITPIKMEVISCAPEREYEQVAEEDLAGANPKEKRWYEQSKNGSGYFRSRDTKVEQTTQTDENGCPTKVDKTYYIGKLKKSFAYVAWVQARERFGDIQFRNYVELEMLPEAFDAVNMRIGTRCEIHYKKETYDTILTGRKVGDTITLMFGTLRVDYTKRTQLSSSAMYTKAKTAKKKSNSSTK